MPQESGLSPFIVLHDHDQGLPSVSGLYVIYVNPNYPQIEGKISYADKKIMFWSNESKKWFYPGSAEMYRDYVYASYGPLPILELE